jgi:hypothetical protein
MKMGICGNSLYMKTTSVCLRFSSVRYSIHGFSSSDKLSMMEQFVDSVDRYNKALKNSKNFHGKSPSDGMHSTHGR